MLDASLSSTPQTKQVEFNTIGSGGAGMSSAVTKLHLYASPSSALISRHLFSSGAYDKHSDITQDRLVVNPATAALAAGLAQAHRQYDTSMLPYSSWCKTQNIASWTRLEYYLLEKHSIQTVRATLHEIGMNAKLIGDRRLPVPTPRR